MAYNIAMAYIVMAYIVMAYIVMAYIVMAYIAMAYIVMAYLVMARLAERRVRAAHVVVVAAKHDGALESARPDRVVELQRHLGAALSVGVPI